MRQIIGYFKKAKVNREYGSLSAYLQEQVIDIAEANIVVFMVGSIAYVAELRNGEETLIAAASNFAFLTDKF